MNSVALNRPAIRALVIKDWQLFQRQLAAYVAGGIAALALIGHAKPWSFYLGSLLLIIIMVAASCFALSTSLLNERKEKTLAFLMSLPVSPLDFYLAKLVGNLITFGVPFAILTGGAVAVTLTTPVTDGLLTLVLLICGHLLLSYCVSLCVAMQVESEGWNIFAMVGGSVLINPLMAGLSQIPDIARYWSTNELVWSWQALSILAAQLLLSLALLAYTSWRHLRKQAFF
ncbi:ABC-type multidrug transport system permease subunit [Inhella inkyongensis]|uniref:ABC-type multidrug transport system permease subunit n=1 Tax=Inhella inkyongensis TaxID=392593 RepID=A0A840S1H3_9BURK|nr:ABC transporter permease [Inhella inkyongensis]MBB5203268.1 ABC-type multidrug transport system permease subunit [Inhella inkyongensis]